MISAAPPAPGHDLLFGPKGRFIPRGPLKFGDTEGYGHGDLEGQADNGCDLWVDMINAGWAVPRDYMQIWAATSNLPDPGIRLLDTLVRHKIEIQDRIAWFALYQERYDLLAYILKLHTPEDDSQCQDLLRLAASHRDGVKYLELLWQHGVNNLNYREASSGYPSYAQGRQNPGPDAAACRGSVWECRRGRVADQTWSRGLA